MSFWSVLGTIGGAIAGTLIAPGVGTAIGAGIGGSALGAIDNANAVDEANQTNIDLANANNQTQLAIAQMNNRTQVDQAEKNREFAAQQSQLAYERQKQLWQLQVGYNSPVEQVKRLQAAGVNPGVAFSNGVTTMAQGIPSAPAAASGQNSGVSPSMPNTIAGHVQPIPGYASSVIESLSKLGMLKKNLSSAGLDDANTNRTISLLDGELKSQLLENDAKEFALSLDKTFGFSDRYSKNYILGQEASLSYQNVLLAIKNNDLKELEKATEVTKARLNDMLAQYHGKQKELVEKQVENFEYELDAKVDSFRSSARASNAQAEMQSEEANLIRERVREAIRNNDVLDFLNTEDAKRLEQNKLLSTRLTPFSQSIYNGLKKAVNEGKISDHQEELVRKRIPYLIEQARQDAEKGEPWTAAYFFDKLLPGSQGAASGVAAAAILAK